MPTKNFIFLIGAPKSGTTSLADWLDRHTNIHLMKDKEPGYFRSNTEKFVLNANHPDRITYTDSSSAMVDFSSYMALTDQAGNHDWVLDASTDYLSDDHSAERIYNFSENYNVKMICILRDPIDRAVSEYLHTVRDGGEPLSFKQSIEQEAIRRERNFQPLYFHIRRSRYYDDVLRFHSLFGDQLLLLEFQELSEPSILANKILDFLNLSKEELGPISQLNPSQLIEKKTSGFRELFRLFFNPKHLKKFFLSPDRPSIASLEDGAALAFRLLESDIRRCLRSPIIPTSGWDRSRSYMRNNNLN